MTLNKDLVAHLLRDIYGEVGAQGLLERLERLVREVATDTSSAKSAALDQKDAVLITYPDQVQAPGEVPLQTLARFADEHLAGLVSTIHILPFYPASSDDGFSVTDYESVDPAFGDWPDIERLHKNFGLIFDAVINHASVRGEWFQGFLLDDVLYRDFFVAPPSDADLRAVVRPRTSPLLTEFAAEDEKRRIWTTFSEDQADLNYRNPEVLLRVLVVLLSYAARGARVLRLDAIGYIWKEIGTNCIHRPQAHAIVSLIRAVMDAAAPHVLLLTETNVGQDENLAYLGDGRPEAHLAYNFALPPLVLHAIFTGQTDTITNWMSNLPTPPAGTALLNVLATHDGIGLNGCRGFLPEGEIERLASRIEAAGGHVSRKSTENGATVPYELNINYMDALDAGPLRATDADSIGRFATAHAIMLAFKGCPAIYFHSLFASRGWKKGVELTGRFRTVNREKLKYAVLNAELREPASFRSRVHSQLSRLLRARQTCASFSPFGAQKVHRMGRGIVAFARGDDGDPEQVLCLHNLTADAQECELGAWRAAHPSAVALDLITSRRVELSSSVGLRLQPFEALWLRMDEVEAPKARSLHHAAAGVQ